MENGTSLTTAPHSNSPVNTGLTLSPQATFYEDELAGLLNDVGDGMATAIDVVRAIRDQGIWTEYSIGYYDADGNIQTSQAFGQFYRDFLPAFLERLQSVHGVVLVNQSSEAWWRNMLRYLDTFEKYGVTSADLLNTNRGVLSRLERIILFKRGTREFVGFAPDIDTSYLPVLVGDGGDKDEAVARALITISLDEEPSEAIKRLDAILKKRSIKFIMRDDTSIYATVWDTNVENPAYQEYELVDFDAWPEFLKREFRNRLRITPEGEFLLEESEDE